MCTTFWLENLSGKPSWERRLRRTGHRREGDNIRIDFRERVGWGGGCGLVLSTHRQMANSIEHGIEASGIS